MKRHIAGASAILLTAALAATAQTSTRSRELTWLFARPADGPVIQSVKEIADEYAKANPGFKLNLITVPDRPGYLQRLETLAAANQLPDMFDTDATPFAAKLRDRGDMLNVGQLLRETGQLAAFRPVALNYQRFDDGSLHMLPLEFHMEWFWYNTDVFRKVGLKTPTTLEQLVAACKPLRAAGYVPIALDGQDRWPLLRYLAFPAFRLSGNDYLNKIKTAATPLDNPTGLRAARFVSDLGKNSCFQEGFSSSGYTDARDLFTSGRAAIYYMGTWELGTMTDPKLPAATRGKIDFFTLPTTAGAKTAPNEYFVVSGIGMALNAKKFDATTRAFVTQLLRRYPAVYAAKGQFPPLGSAKPTAPVKDPLFDKAFAMVDKIGTKYGVPWDTQLDPSSNTRLGQELILLAQNNVTPEAFAKTMTGVIKQNAPRFFGAR